MNKYDTIKGPSCLTHAADDEPLFVLRANDELAPDTVLMWAYRYKSNKSAQPGGMTPAQTEKFESALKVSMEMFSWRNRK